MLNIVLALSLVVAVSCDVSHILHSGGGHGGDAHAAILKQDSDIQPDGSYQWSYETENGIGAEEQGRIQQLSADQVAKSAQGSFHWTSPEGQGVQIQYIADENGYQPQGDLPVPPPIPAAIQRALEWIASHPQPERRN